MLIMKNIKKPLIVLVTIFSFTSVVVACGTKTATVSKKANQKNQTKTDTSNSKSNQTDQTNTNTKNGKANQTDETTQVTKENLSQAELDFFTNYFSDVNNNGFLLCTYNDPIQIDLNNVLYAGAGSDRNMPAMTDAERSAYLKAAGEDDIYLDMHRITTKQINDLLQQKAGITLSQVTNQLSWIYLKDYDTYYHEQGDTNYCTFTCTSGYKTSDGLYVIECKNPKGDDGQFINKCEVTLTKVGDSYIFKSNKVEG